MKKDIFDFFIVFINIIHIARQKKLDHLLSRPSSETLNLLKKHTTVL